MAPIYCFCWKNYPFWFSSNKLYTITTLNMYVLKTKVVTLKTCWFWYVVTTRKHKANILLFHNFLKSLFKATSFYHCQTSQYFRHFFKSCLFPLSVTWMERIQDMKHFTSPVWRPFFLLSIHFLLYSAGDLSFRNIHTTLH